MRGRREHANYVGWLLEPLALPSLPPLSSCCLFISVWVVLFVSPLCCFRFVLTIFLYFLCIFSFFFLSFVFWLLYFSISSVICWFIGKHNSCSSNSSSSSSKKYEKNYNNIDKKQQKIHRCGLVKKYIINSLSISCRCCVDVHS